MSRWNPLDASVVFQQAANQILSCVCRCQSLGFLLWRTDWCRLHLSYRKLWIDFCQELPPALWMLLSFLALPLCFISFIICYVLVVVWGPLHHIREAKPALCHDKLCQVLDDSGVFRVVASPLHLPFFVKCEAAVCRRFGSDLTWHSFGLFSSAFTGSAVTPQPGVDVLGGRPRRVSASCSQVTYCPVKYTAHWAERAKQCRVTMMYLDTKPESVARISAT